MNPLLTLLLITSFYFCHGQDSLQIHVDTVKMVTYSYSRHEGVNGKLYGPLTRQALKETYRKKEGYNKMYREDGKLYFEGRFKKVNDSLVNVGIFKYYNKAGLLDYTHDFDSNTRAYYFSNGTKKSEGSMSQVKPDERSGTWICFYPSGTIKSTGNLKGDLKYGSWKYFEEKGKLREEKNYKQYTGCPLLDCCDW